MAKSHVESRLPVRRASRAAQAYRSLTIELLEVRACPTYFDYIGIVGGDLTFEGTSGNDTLNAIYIGANGNIWWEPAPFWGGPRDTLVLAPSAAAPIRITIKGLEGNDTVDLWGGAASTANLV